MTDVDSFRHAYYDWEEDQKYKMEEQRREDAENFFMKLVILAAIATMLFFTLSYAHASEPITLKASWYSMESLKKEGTFKTSKGVMANGKVFNELDKTCATRLFGPGTKLRITSETGKSVDVIVTDRIGKRFATTRIDLSKSAFMAIGDLKSGVIPVQVEVIK